MRVSYLEVYNEQFFDLLNPAGGMLDDLAVREDDQGLASLSLLHCCKCIMAAWCSSATRLQAWLW